MPWSKEKRKQYIVRGFAVDRETFIVFEDVRKRAGLTQCDAVTLAFKLFISHLLPAELQKIKGGYVANHNITLVHVVQRLRRSPSNSNAAFGLCPRCGEEPANSLTHDGKYWLCAACAREYWEEVEGP